MFPIGWIVQGGTRRRLTRAERTAYDAPFPSAEYRAAARAYPSLVPVSDYSPVASADNHRAWKASDPSHATLRGRHFLQEDDAGRFAQLVVTSCGDPC